MEGWLHRIAVTHWAHQDSNLEPRDYESPALPLSYGPALTVVRPEPNSNEHWRSWQTSASPTRAPLCYGQVKILAKARNCCHNRFQAAVSRLPDRLLDPPTLPCRSIASHYFCLPWALS